MTIEYSVIYWQSPSWPLSKHNELAQTMESADHDAKELQGMPAATVKKLKRDTPKRSPITAGLAYHKNIRNSCYHCGGKYPASDCRFRQSECRFCKKMGHTKKSAVLSSSRKGPGDILCKLTIYPLRIPLSRVMSRRPQKNTLCSIFRAVSHLWWSNQELNGSPISMELDTGAGISIVSEQTYNQLWRETIILQCFKTSCAWL